MTENKRFKIVDEQFISYYGGTGYKISNEECGFWLWHSKEESQKVCDKLNSILDEIEQLKKKNLKLKKGLDNDLKLIISLQDKNNQLKELSDCEKLQKVLIKHKEHLLNCKRHDEPTAYWDGALDCIDNISEIIGVDLE